MDDTRGDPIKAARLAIGIMCVLTWAAAGPVGAADSDQPQLRFEPAEDGSPHIDLTMRGGEARTLDVEITNGGEASVVAHTYAADVYTATNGGFRVRPRDASATGATEWVEYEPATLDLGPSERSRRSLTVTVPIDTGPGEYITALVLETAGDDVPISRERHAIAVVVTVPGERVAELEIGDVQHVLRAGMSVLAVEVSNPGNVRIQPVVAAVLRGSAGEYVSDAVMQMDSFYAGADTTVQIAIGSRLAADTYAVELIAEDVQQRVNARVNRTLILDAEGSSAATGTPLLTATMDIAGTQVPVLVLVAVLGGVAMVAGTRRVALHRTPGPRRS